jgi:thioesterase domain-containing protein
VAFELAQQLRRSGREVLALALFDAEGPGGRSMVPNAERLRIHLHQLRKVGPRYLRARADRVAEQVRERSDALRLKVHRGLGRETPEELWMHQFVMANVRAADAYQAEPYEGRLVVFRAADELFDAPEAISSGLGWASVAAGRLDVIEVPGKHISMLAEPAVAELARALRGALDGD